MRNVANRSILYQQFADGGAEEVGGIVPAPWMGIDEAEHLNRFQVGLELDFLYLQTDCKSDFLFFAALV